MTEQTKMREEFEQWRLKRMETIRPEDDYLDSSSAWAAWQAAVAQADEKIAKLEAELADSDLALMNSQENEQHWVQRAAAAELSNKQLRDAGNKLDGAAEEYEGDDGNYIGVDMDDWHEFTEALAQQPSTEALDAYVAKLIPPGWRVVPIEPTANMLEAAWSNSDKELMAAEYRAMLKVAPLPPAPDQDKEQERWTM